MSAGEKALSMVLRIFLCRGVLAQNAIHQFRELSAQAVEHALEQGGFDILDRLVQQRVGELQGLAQACGMLRLSFERQRRCTLFRRLGEKGNVARIMWFGW